MIIPGMETWRRYGSLNCMGLAGKFGKKKTVQMDRMEECASLHTSNIYCDETCVKQNIEMWVKVLLSIKQYCSQTHCKTFNRPKLTVFITDT